MQIDNVKYEENYSAACRRRVCITHMTHIRTNLGIAAMLSFLTPVIVILPL